MAEPPSTITQSVPVLRTKLFIPPLRRDLVPRSRLTECLDQGLRQGHQVLLVSAPAGFGKTTLVSEWIHTVGANGHAPLPDAPGHGTPIHVAWLSLDEGDNDPSRFLIYVIAALRSVKADLGQGVFGALQSPQPPIEAILTSVINEITALPGTFILVLDDYHLIEAQQVHDALAFLLEHLPSQMRLVIATREDPHLPLARLRARGQLTELRATELRFTSTEAAEFLNQVMGLDLSAPDVAALEARTEGWIAGLQLAALALQGLALQGTPSMQGRQDAPSLIRAFTGSHRYVLDYLIEEVLEQQPPKVQTCLLQTSVLDRLTGSLCEAVCFGVAEADAMRFGSAESPSSSFGVAGDGQALLERLEHANLFVVPLDEERRWYRYHHLFADLLRQRLRQQHPDWVPALHRRASEWYEQNGYVDKAIEHALHAEDFARAAGLLEQHVDALWQRGEHTRLRRWLAALPEELLFSRPHLCILHAWNLFTSGQQQEAEGSLQAAERALEPTTGETDAPPPSARDPVPDLERRTIRGRAAAIRAFLAFYRGEAQGTREYARQALQLLPEEDMTWRSTATVALGDAHSFAGDLAGAYRVRSEAVEAGKAAGNVYMVLIASMKLAVTMRMQGRLERVIETCRQNLRLANEIGLSQTVVVGWLLTIWGEVLAEQNDLDGAIEKARRGAELTANGKDIAAVGWSYLCLVRVLFSSGDMSGAEEAIQRMGQIAREHYVPPWIANPMAAWQARIWLAQHKLDTAAQWAGKRMPDTGAGPAYLEAMEHTVLARILIAQGRLERATGLLQRLLEMVEPLGHTSRAIEVLNLLALASQAGGDPAQAMAALERALSLAGPAGFARTFVDEGAPMARLLRAAAARGIMPDYTAKLLAAFETTDEKPALSQSKGRQTTDASLDPASVVGHPSSDLVEPLSARELEVLELISGGLTNREIASRLFISLNTVKAHTRNIYGKLGVHNRTQAVATARDLGVLPTV